MMESYYTTLFSIIGTILVALIAAAGSFVVGRSAKSHEWRLAIVKEKLTNRRRIYAAFLAEADRLMLVSLDKKLSEASSFRVLGSFYSEIQITSPEEIVRFSTEIFDAILEFHSVDPQKRDNYSRIKTLFINAVKTEMATIERDLK